MAAVPYCRNNVLRLSGPISFTWLNSHGILLFVDEFVSNVDNPPVITTALDLPSYHDVRVKADAPVRAPDSAAGAECRGQCSSHGHVFPTCVVKRKDVKGQGIHVLNTDVLTHPTFALAVFEHALVKVR